MSRVQSISRAFAVLDALGGPPLGVTAIAERVGLPKSTTGRLLQSLADEGVVEQVEGGTDYRIGARIAALFAASRPSGSLIALARPHLQALALVTGEVSGISVAEGRMVHHMYHEQPAEQDVQVRNWTGTRLPMHVVAPGLVFLAHLADGELDRYLAGPLERFAARSMTDPAALRARLAQVRAVGFAWTRDEAADGISSVSAGVVSAGGEVVAAVHLHWPTYRFPDAGAPAGRALVTRVVDAAAVISADLRRPG